MRPQSTPVVCTALAVEGIFRLLLHGVARTTPLRSASSELAENDPPEPTGENVVMDVTFG
jgi:hypothetical protein